MCFSLFSSYLWKVWKNCKWIYQWDIQCLKNPLLIYAKHYATPFMGVSQNVLWHPHFFNLKNIQHWSDCHILKRFPRLWLLAWPSSFNLKPIVDFNFSSHCYEVIIVEACSCSLLYQSLLQVSLEFCKPAK